MKLRKILSSAHAVLFFILALLALLGDWKDTMPTAAIAFVIFALICLYFGRLWWMTRRAPLGYKDEQGFHYGTPPGKEQSNESNG